MLRSRIVGLAAVGISLVLTGCGGPEVIETSSGVTVLVAEPQNAGMDALSEGALADVGGCLGLGDHVVVWPNGTDVVDEDPLTIDLNGARYELGEEVSVGGGFVFEHSSDDRAPGPLEVGGVEVPEECAKFDVFLASPS